jgi:hypothetical protein
MGKVSKVGILNNSILVDSPIIVQKNGVIRSIKVNKYKIRTK